MANKGAIDLIVTRAALDQVKDLNAKLERTEKQMIKISNLARSSQGNFKQTKGTKDLNAQLKKQNSILIQIVKNNKKYHVESMKAAASQKKVAKSLRETGKAAKQTSSRVGSFFKTLVAFDLARRAVDAFWGSFTRGFEEVKKLDSLRLQFQYLVSDSQEAAVTQSFLLRVSEELGVSILTLSESYLAFRKSAELANLGAKETRQVFEDVTRAASLLGKSEAQIQNVQVALEQMLSKGTVQAEELKKQLGNVLPGSFEIMAKAVDKLNPDIEVTNEVFNKMLKAGKIIAADVLPEFAKQLKIAYGIENVKRIDNLQAATTRLDNAFTQMIMNMEGGTGNLSKALLFFVDVARELVVQFGEMFLSGEELAKLFNKMTFEQGFTEGVETVDKLNKKYNDRKKVMVQTTRLIAGEKQKLDEMNKELERLQELVEKDPLALYFSEGMTKDDVENKIKSISKLIGISDGFIQGAVKRMKELNEETEDTSGSEKRAKAYALEGNQAEGLIEKLERLKKIYETMQKTTKDPVEAAGFKNQIDAVKGFIDILEGQDVAGKVAADGLKDWSKSMAEDLKRLGHALETSEEDMKLYMQGLAEIQALEQDISFAAYDYAATVVDSILEMKLNAIDREMEKLQERYDLQKELIDLEEGDAEAKEERLRQLEKERRIREKKLEKEREKAEKKAFLVQQAIMAATVVAETAKGIAVATATYGSNPITAPLLGPIISLIIGTGAIQLGTILAQSIPKFKDGHLSGTHEGSAIINDGGRMEVVERRGGAIEMFSAKDAMIHMQRGDKVHKSIDSFLERGGSMDHLVRASGFSGFGIGGFSDVRSEALGLKNEIRDGFKNVKITNDNSSIGRVVADAISDSKYENGFL